MNDNVNGTRNDTNYIDVLCAGVENNTTDRSGIEIGSSDVVKLLATSTLTIVAPASPLVITSAINSDSNDIKLTGILVHQRCGHQLSICERERPKNVTD